MKWWVDKEWYAVLRMEGWGAGGTLYTRDGLSVLVFDRAGTRVVVKTLPGAPGGPATAEQLIGVAEKLQPLTEK